MTMVTLPRQARWNDLQDEIETMFAELTPGRDEVTSTRETFPLAVGGGLRGYRTFDPHRNPPKSPRTKAYNRRFTAKWEEDRIRERILAGERPKKPGGRGRPPTRWIQIAASMGIDLWAPVAAPAPAAKAAA